METSETVECYNCGGELAIENAVENDITGSWWCRECAKEATRYV